MLLRAEIQDRRQEDIKPCARCGVRRRVHSGRASICRDCRDCLTPIEREAWQ